MTDNDLSPNRVKVGDAVLFVHGMPRPDQSKGSVVAVHDDGSFDVQVGAVTLMNAEILGQPRTAQSSPVGVGSVAKFKRVGVSHD